jgi:calcineurin-like phosphoesterase family protein
MGFFREQLNGNIVLIKGNHNKVQNGQIKNLFTLIDKYLEIKVFDKDVKDNWQSITMCHFAARLWNRCHYGTYHLYGHSHGSLYDDPNSLSIDVGVDCHNFTRISYQQVKEIMSKKTFVPIDHHR